MMPLAGGLARAGSQLLLQVQGFPKCQISSSDSASRDRHSKLSGFIRGLTGTVKKKSEQSLISVFKYICHES